MDPCNISCLCIYFGLHVSYSADISGFDIIFKQVSVLIDYFAFSSKTCSQANKFYERQTSTLLSSSRQFARQFFLFYFWN